jgi:putative ABC transport system permease protein
VEFVRLVAMAFAVAAPVAYLLVDRWLQDFAYRIKPGMLTFVLAALLAVGIALLTVGYHAARAATADPVRALRYE